jgi:hypothetical protein
MRRIIDERVERHHRQDRGEYPARVGAVGPHQALRRAGGRKVRVDDGDLVAVAHGAQDRQEVRGEQRVDTDQHGRSS